MVVDPGQQQLLPTARVCACCVGRARHTLFTLKTEKDGGQRVPKGMTTRRHTWMSSLLGGACCWHLHWYPTPPPPLISYCQSSLSYFSLCCSSLYSFCSSSADFSFLFLPSHFLLVMLLLFIFLLLLSLIFCCLCSSSIHSFFCFSFLACMFLLFTFLLVPHFSFSASALLLLYSFSPPLLFCCFCSCSAYAYSFSTFYFVYCLCFSYLIFLPIILLSSFMCSYSSSL